MRAKWVVLLVAIPSLVFNILSCSDNKNTAICDTDSARISALCDTIDSLRSVIRGTVHSGLGFGDTVEIFITKDNKVCGTSRPASRVPHFVITEVDEEEFYKQEEIYFNQEETE